MHDGDSLGCGHYFSDLFNASKIIWWNCNDDEITEISYLSEGVYTKEIKKKIINKKLMYGSEKYCWLFIS